jgi:hypothetical protein
MQSENLVGAPDRHGAEPASRPVTLDRRALLTLNLRLC